MENRILLLASRGRDAQVMEQLLCRQSHDCVTCESVDQLAAELVEGAGVALLTEESLGDSLSPALADWLTTQPPWSDFPFILLATKRAGLRPLHARDILEQLGNVIVLERPLHGETLVRSVASALRGRARQYEARRGLDELQAAEERLRLLNTTLETRISERTDQLLNANNQLMQEVAERERAQAALAQSQKMEAVGQLTGGIAHDFNNLLTVIFGNLELIQRRSEDPSIDRLAGFARQAADRAARLTHQLLAFSRTQRLTLAPVDINGLVVGMDDLLARTIGARIRIEMDLDDQAPWAMADANQLELAILNLAINARDAMAGDGLLRICSTVRAALGGDLAPGRYAVLTVSDTGGGIPPHLLAKVFDPFFTTKPIGKGTGLGLSQVYGIAQQSGGTVRISSVEGQGSSVELWLPITAPAAPGSIAPVAIDRAREGPRERVLVIDDDDGVRGFIVECLNGLGYAVEEAADGDQGLDQLARARPDLMIVDYAMPGLSGAEVVARARTLAPGLPIIMATGYADMEPVDRVLQPENILRKPFRIDDLESAIRRALSLKQAA